MKTKHRILAFVAALTLVGAASATTSAEQAEAGNLTQVCYSASSPRTISLPIKKVGYSGYSGLNKGQCAWGVESVGDFGWTYQMTDYGYLPNFNGNLLTPKAKTYTVIVY